MRLAHLADLHLGFRQFDRYEEGGGYLREGDVERAFAAAVDQIVAEAPDAVLVAGDVFHQVRPTNRAILAAYRGVARLRAAVADVVVIAGDHDSPKTADTGRILPLLELAGARVVLGAPERVQLPGCVVTCVPSLGHNYRPVVPAPLEGARNVLLLHGDVAGYGGQAATIDPACLAGWDYAALGDYHSLTEVRPWAWYSGSIEYTSTNVWADLAAGPKCWLLVELDGGPPRVQPRAIPTRLHVDLPPFDATGLSPAEVDARLADRIAEFPIDGAVARLVVLNVPREVQRHLDHAAIRRWKAAAVNFNLALRRPEAETLGTPASRARMHETLDARVQRFLDERDLPADVSRPDLKELAARYMDEARSAAAEKEPG